MIASGTGVWAGVHMAGAETKRKVFALLPELVVLHQEMSAWRASITSPRADVQQANVVRLEQYILTLDSAMKQIRALSHEDDLSKFELLESKINSSIMPIRDKLVARMHATDGISAAPSSSSSSFSSIRQHQQQHQPEHVPFAVKRMPIEQVQVSRNRTVPAPHIAPRAHNAPRTVEDYLNEPLDVVLNPTKTLPPGIMGKRSKPLTEYAAPSRAKSHHHQHHHYQSHHSQQQRSSNLGDGSLKSSAATAAATLESNQQSYRRNLRHGHQSSHADDMDGLTDDVTETGSIESSSTACTTNSSKSGSVQRAPMAFSEESSSTSAGSGDEDMALHSSTAGRNPSKYVGGIMSRNVDDDFALGPTGSAENTSTEMFNFGLGGFDWDGCGGGSSTARRGGTSLAQRGRSGSDLMSITDGRGVVAGSSSSQAYVHDDALLTSNGVGASRSGSSSTIAASVKRKLVTSSSSSSSSSSSYSSSSSGGGRDGGAFLSNNAPHYSSASSTCMDEMEIVATLTHRGSKKLSNSSSSSSSSSNQQPLCGSSGDMSVDDEYVSQRRRRRLNQIVPNPRKPRSVEFTCSSCSEKYTQNTLENPWWAIFKQECGSCKQMQIPRIDITNAFNAVEHDPNVQALYGQGVEDSGEEDGEGACEDDDEEAEKESVGGTGFEEEEHVASTETFGQDGMLGAAEASKLLVLMCHARTCRGNHASPKHAEICKSTKFLMLHVRDCSGIDIRGGRECTFPWCSPCKRMLQHLLHCYSPDTCIVCNPASLPEPFQQLKEINDTRHPATASSVNTAEAATADDEEQQTSSELGVAASEEVTFDHAASSSSLHSSSPRILPPVPTFDI